MILEFNTNTPDGDNLLARHEDMEGVMGGKNR